MKNKNLNSWKVQDWLDEADAYAAEVAKRKALGEPFAREEDLRECCILGAEKKMARGRAISNARIGVPRGSRAKSDRPRNVIPAVGTLKRQVYDLLLAGKTTKEICIALPIAKRRSVITIVSLFRTKAKT
jgi:hypothetical protein